MESDVELAGDLNDLTLRGPPNIEYLFLNSSTPTDPPPNLSQNTTITDDGPPSASITFSPNLQSHGAAPYTAPLSAVTTHGYPPFDHDLEFPNLNSTSMLDFLQNDWDFPLLPATRTYNAGAQTLQPASEAPEPLQRQGPAPPDHLILPPGFVLTQGSNIPDEVQQQRLRSSGVQVEIYTPTIVNNPLTRLFSCTGCWRHYRYPGPTSKSTEEQFTPS